MQEVAAGVEVAVIGGVNVAELVVRKWKREGRYVSNKKRIPKVEEEKVVGGKMVQGTCKV